MDNLWSLDRYFGAKETNPNTFTTVSYSQENIDKVFKEIDRISKEKHTQTITIDTISKEDYLSSLSYVEIIELITKQYMDIEIFGSLDRKRKVLDYISVTKLKPKRLLSCEYVLQLEKYSEEDELEV